MVFVMQTVSLYRGTKVEWRTGLGLICGADVRFRVPAQPVDATQALNLSAGVSNPKVSRGRSLS